MGTHAMTILKNREAVWDDSLHSYTHFQDVEVARFYRHFDGYPECHGADIAEALYYASLENGINNRNWCQYFLKHLCSYDIDIEFIAHDDNIWCDYTYVITGAYANYGGKGSIGCDDYLNAITVDVYCGDDEDDKIFTGNASEFIDWINNNA